jgi:hypothetical protein
MQIGLKTVIGLLKAKAPPTLVGVVSCELVTIGLYGLVNVGLNGYNESEKGKKKIIGLESKVKLLEKEIIDLKAPSDSTIGSHLDDSLNYVFF